MQSLKEMKILEIHPPVMTHSVLVGTSFQTSCHKILPMQTHPPTHRCTHTHTHTHMCRHTHIHAQVHIHACTHIHTLNKWAQIHKLSYNLFYQHLVYVCVKLSTLNHKYGHAVSVFYFIINMYYNLANPWILVKLVLFFIYFKQSSKKCHL